MASIHLGTQALNLDKAPQNPELSTSEQNTQNIWENFINISEVTTTAGGQTFQTFQSASAPMMSNYRVVPETVVEPTIIHTRSMRQSPSEHIHHMPVQEIFPEQDKLDEILSTSHTSDEKNIPTEGKESVSEAILQAKNYAAIPSLIKQHCSWKNFGLVLILGIVQFIRIAYSNLAIKIKALLPSS